jgi:hypothetical protein
MSERSRFKEFVDQMIDPSRELHSLHELHEFISDACQGEFDEITNFRSQTIQIEPIKQSLKDRKRGVKKAVRLTLSDLESDNIKTWEIRYFGKATFEADFQLRPPKKDPISSPITIG